MGGSALVEIVAPLLGNVFSVAMLLSPLPAVWHVRSTGVLGALNPLPYPLTVLNCVGWIAYGLSLKDLWLVPANVTGLAAGLFFTMQALPYLSRRVQDIFMGLLVAAVVYFSTLGAIGCIALSEAGRNQMWGIQSVVILMFYYAIPLSTMLEVIKTRNAVSIYIPLAVASVCNGGLWTVYGLFAAHDFNIWMPNGLGTLLALLQLALRFFYGAKADHHPLGHPQQSEHGLHHHDLDHHAEGKQAHRDSLDGPHVHELRAGSATGLLDAHKASIPSHLPIQPSPFPTGTMSIPTTVALGSPADYLPSTPAAVLAVPGA